MTDRELVAALTEAVALERRAREQWTASQEDLPERDAALVVVRLVTPLRRALETWMTARACRAAMRHT